jgi:GntR family transcriptional regulator
MEVIDDDNPDPVYVQLAAWLEARILSGEISGRMPSERAMAEMYGVAYGSIRHAMDVLRGRGLVRTVHGRGTFAVKPDAS